MFYVSEIQTEAPCHFQTPLQELVYGALKKLQIPFERVDTDEAISMEDCVAIDEKLSKLFRSKEFSSALNIARVSFAPAEKMEAMLGTKIGAATVFSSLLDQENKVQIIFDKDVLSEEWYGCSDGTTTGYMKVRTDDIYQKFLPFTKHAAAAIEVR